MNHRFARAAVLAPACLTLLLLAGCSSISSINVDKLWPFDGKSGTAQARALANATQYQCTGGKHFYVRFMDNGATAWLIYPDREVSLTKGSSGSRYSNGGAVLEINGNETTLNDGTAIAYTGCKAIGK